MRSFSGDFLHISYEKIEEKEMVEKTNNTTYTLFILGELLLFIIHENSLKLYMFS